VAVRPATVLVVDDDDSFGTFLADTLSGAGLSAIHATDGAAALAHARDERPELVLLDVCLPDLSGYEICRQLRESHGEEIGIILVSGERVERLDRTAGILIGADDYLVKPVEPGELLARVRRLLARSAAHRPARPRARAAGLTPREQEILQLLAEGKDADVIAGRLFISSKTVASHVQRILSKLNVSSRAQAVAVAYRDGLVSPTDHGPDTSEVTARAPARRHL
jgi:DNA-binding NarL/FixJ family response regulator